MFEQNIDSRSIEEIRAATNKFWVLGGEYYKAKIEQKPAGRANLEKRVEIDVLKDIAS